jgi:hypothetical protein
MGTIRDFARVAKGYQNQNQPIELQSLTKLNEQDRQRLDEMNTSYIDALNDFYITQQQSRIHRAVNKIKRAFRIYSPAQKSATNTFINTLQSDLGQTPDGIAKTKAILKSAGIKKNKPITPNQILKAYFKYEAFATSNLTLEQSYDSDTGSFTPKLRMVHNLIHKIKLRFRFD